MEDQNFWNDVEASNRIMKEMKNLKDTIADFNAIQETFDDIEVMIEMAEEEDDVDLIEEAGESIEQFKKKFEAFRIETLLSGEFDTNNAVINIHSGAGGTESCDWVSMLYRMYQRWANDKGFSVEEFDNQPGDEAGYADTGRNCRYYDTVLPAQLYRRVIPEFRCLPESRYDDGASHPYGAAAPRCLSF